MQAMRQGVGMSPLAMRQDMNRPPYTDMQRTARVAESLAGVFNDRPVPSRRDPGQIRIENTVFDLRQLVEQVVDLVAIAARDKDLGLIVDYSTNLGRWYRGAPPQITQVLVCLLSNAITFTDTGTVRLGVSRSVPGVLRFEVEDTGVGIAPEEQRRLFLDDPQAQRHATPCRLGGAGRGLVIARRLVELMGGDIEVTSEPGWGSCFAFEIEALASSSLPPNR